MADDLRESRRKRAFQLMQEGLTHKEIAEKLDVTRGAISQWLKRAREMGEEALKAQPRPGAPARLSVEQLSRIPELLERGPEAYGFRGQIWTAVRVAEVIRREFGIEYDQRHVRRLLARCHWTSQKPAVAAAQRDEERIRKWREERWPELKKKP